MDYNELQNWLDDLKKIPTRPPRKRTLMDITGIKHHENLWSDIYRFFLTTNEEHQLGDLFIRSLESLLGVKSCFLEAFSVTREFAVNEKKIDLLLFDNRNNRAIIIENKVNHILNNDLNFYYRKVHEKGYSDIIVIVLGIKKYQLNLYNKANCIPANKLFSLTHQEFMDEIGKELPYYYKKASPQYLYLLQEFLKNITNKTNDMNTDELSFYYSGENRVKINALADIRKNVIAYISDSIQNKEILKPLFDRYGLSKLDVDKCRNNKYIYYPYEKYAGRLMITLVYNTLWDFNKNGCRIQAILEIQGDMIKWVRENVSGNSMVGLEEHHNYWHFSSCDIPFSQNELVNDFQENLCKKLSVCPVYKLGIDIIEKYEKSKV